MSDAKDILSSEELIDNITISIEQFSDHAALQNASYETGLLGYALYYLYLSRYKNDPAYLERAGNYFEKGMAALDLKNFKRTYDTDSLDLHLSHIGRFAIFCQKHQLLDINSSEYLDQLDNILFDLMKSKISIKDFDSGSGATASAFYFLARHLSGVSQADKLAYLVNSIENFAIKDKHGHYYWHSPSLYDRIYLGISHGSAMIISVVSNIHQFGIEKEVCERIIEKGVSFLLMQYRRTEYKGLFPTKIGDKRDPMQFALCYGDVGTGYAIYRAAQVLESRKIKDFADLVLNDCLLRTKEDNLTLDAGIYYGASGLGIAFDKVALVTSDKRFSERADYWYGEIPKYAIHENQFAGFQSRLSADSVIWNVSEGWGIMGIGISLMYFLNKKLPSMAELTLIA